MSWRRETCASRLAVQQRSLVIQQQLEHRSPQPLEADGRRGARAGREVYVSSTIGLRKPEAEAYDYVVRAIGVSADRIVFFDDSLENIEGARARGLQAVHVKSGADLADALAVLIERNHFRGS